MFMKSLVKLFGEATVLTQDKVSALSYVSNKLQEQGFHKHTTHSYPERHPNYSYLNINKNEVCNDKLRFSLYNELYQLFRTT